MSAKIEIKQYHQKSVQAERCALYFFQHNRTSISSTIKLIWVLFYFEYNGKLNMVSGFGWIFSTC